MFEVDERKVRVCVEGAAAGLNVGAVGAELGPRVAVGAVPDARMHERATCFKEDPVVTAHARIYLFGGAYHFLQAVGDGVHQKTENATAELDKTAPDVGLPPCTLCQTCCVCFGDGNRISAGQKRIR